MKATLFIIILFICCADSMADDNFSLQVRTIDISPYGIKANQLLSGVYYDMANLLLDRVGISREHHIYPYVRIMHELKTGKTDLTIMFKYKELAPFVEYIFPLPPLKNVVIGRKAQVFDSIESLHGKTIAYLRGAKFSDDIDKNSAIKKYTVINFEQGLLMLKNGRVDAIIGPLEPIYNAANKLNLTKGFFNSPLVVSKRVPWLQVSKKSLHKISKKQLETVFSTLIKQGHLTRIKAEYVKLGNQ